MYESLQKDETPCVLIFFSGEENSVFKNKL